MIRISRENIRWHFPYCRQESLRVGRHSAFNGIVAKAARLGPLSTELGVEIHVLWSDSTEVRISVRIGMRVTIASHLRSPD